MPRFGNQISRVFIELVLEFKNNEKTSNSFSKITSDQVQGKMKPILLSFMMFLLTVAFVKSGSEQRNLANRTSRKFQGRTIRVEDRRLSQKLRQVKELEQNAKLNKEQGLHHLAEKHSKASQEIEKSAKLNQDNLAVLSKKQPARITKTLSGKQRIVPAIAIKQAP